jgi:hypothetical protein
MSYKISELDEASAGHANYVRAYASYVLYRSKFYSGRFEELASLEGGTPLKKVLLQLKRAQNAIELALLCEEGKKTATAISGFAVKQVSKDLIDLYAILGEKLETFQGQIEEQEVCHMSYVTCIYTYNNRHNYTPYTAYTAYTH